MTDVYLQSVLQFIDIGLLIYEQTIKTSNPEIICKIIPLSYRRKNLERDCAPLPQPSIRTPRSACSTLFPVSSFVSPIHIHDTESSPHFFRNRRVPLRALMESSALSNATSSMPARESWILRLPLELLYKIFDLLTPYNMIRAESNDFTDILAVRNTCRGLRAICSTLKFWYDENFCISQLIPRHYDHRRKFKHLDHDNRAQRLLECFKADEILMETMKRKGTWSFCTTSALIVASQCVPSFNQQITSLIYESYSIEYLSNLPSPLPPFNSAFEHLGFCPNMTTLLIAQDMTHISLDCISRCCPFLQKLELYCNGTFSGSLQGLCNLREFIVWDYTTTEEPHWPKRNLLPIGSASSLRDFNVSYTYGPRENPYNSEHLLSFINLSSYTIAPLCDGICNTLINTPFSHLRTFTTAVRTFSHINVDKILEILASRSLNSLQTLRLLLEPFNSEFNARYLDIIRTITSQLSSTLEELQLTSGINTAWCQQFSSLRKLKKIIWMAADQECCDSNNSLLLPFEGGGENMSDRGCIDMSQIVTEKMTEAFREFEKLPLIHIIVLNEDVYDEWDNFDVIMIKQMRLVDPSY